MPNMRQLCLHGGQDLQKKLEINEVEVDRNETINYYITFTTMLDHDEIFLKPQEI